jgi:hypothetical protein
MATGGAGGMKTGGAGGSGGTVTGGVGGTGSGGSGGTVAGGAGGSATGGSTATGGIAGSDSDGGVSTGGAGGAATGGAGGGDAGPVPDDSYSACRSVGGYDRLIVTKTIAQEAMCVTLSLRFGGAANTLGLTLPSLWNVEIADRWPVSIAPCSNRFVSFRLATHASSGTGTVIINGSYYSSSFTVDVDLVLNFPLGDAGVSESEILQGKAMPVSGACSTIIYPDASSGS